MSIGGVICEVDADIDTIVCSDLLSETSVGMTHPKKRLLRDLVGLCMSPAFFARSVSTPTNLLGPLNREGFLHGLLMMMLSRTLFFPIKCQMNGVFL